MKFESIKAGDTVYIRESVRTGWSTDNWFWLPVNVDRVTPKQFVAGRKKYSKNDGRCIGGGYGEKAAKLGDYLGYEGLVEDQSGKRERLLKDLHLVREITDVIDQFKIDHNHPRLVEIHAKLKAVSSMLVEA